MSTRLAQGRGRIAVERTAGRLRHLILQESKRAGVGHIGSALSVADILETLFTEVMSGVGETTPDRDLFILSKGHAALALYCALHTAGLLDEAALATYCADGSLLGVHPEHALPGVDFSTGSLGQGLSLGAGAALSARLRDSPRTVYVLLSDAELNEGSTWEAVMFAAHHRLSNLVAILDDNGQQALGRTRDVIDMEPLDDKWRAFGWRVTEVDGHDRAALASVLRRPAGGDAGPRLVHARTVCGKGVSFMEGQVAWHYLPMDDEQYAAAIGELEAAP